LKRGTDFLLKIIGLVSKMTKPLIERVFRLLESNRKMNSCTGKVVGEYLLIRRKQIQQMIKKKNKGASRPSQFILMSSREAKVMMKT
jgi:hypothetical protein